MKLGETYHSTGHLWVVASLPDADGAVVMLSLTTHRPRCDENCVIEPGEHPFVIRKTVIAYEKALVFDAATQARAERLCHRHPPVSAELLARIQQGACASDLTPQKIAKAIRASMIRQAAK